MCDSTVRTLSTRRSAISAFREALPGEVDELALAHRQRDVGGVDARDLERAARGAEIGDPRKLVRPSDAGWGGIEGAGRPAPGDRRRRRLPAGQVPTAAALVAPRATSRPGRATSATARGRLGSGWRRTPG